jgi:predicted lipoprotein with Yx(FWY)xxD motif
MKRMLIGLAAIFLSGSVALAAVPWKTMKTSKGTVWATQSGMTLYTFHKDPRNKSTCYGQCAVYWPPLRATSNSRAVGEWTVVKRSDGSLMWAYEGHPLYTFIRDKRPGQVTGDGVYQFGALWHVAMANAHGSYMTKAGGSYKPMGHHY